MDLNAIGTIASIVSLVLAVVFWILATMQASKADRTLNEIKDKIMSWQDRMNTAAINLIEARPEVIAQKVSLEEAKNNAEFVDRIASLIEKLATEADEITTGFKVVIMKELLSHQKALIVDREKIKTDFIIRTGER